MRYYELVESQSLMNFWYNHDLKKRINAPKSHTETAVKKMGYGDPKKDYGEENTAILKKARNDGWIKIKLHDYSAYMMLFLDGKSKEGMQKMVKSIFSKYKPDIVVLQFSDTKYYELNDREIIDFATKGILPKN